MLQTRAEAASLVVQLQRTAVTQGLMFYGIAAVTGLAFMTAVIVWIAVEAPPSWRGWALGLITVALLATAVFSVLTAGRKLKHDAELIADFSRGVKLDLAMINLAIKDPDTEDEDKLAERERAKEKVREAAVDKATAPSTAEGGAPSPGGPAMESAAAAMRAAAPRPDVTPEGTAETDADARATSTRAASAGGIAATGAPDVDTSGPPPQTRAGYAFTGGGTYASTSPPAPVVEDHAMPEALANPGAVAPTSPDDDTERKQRHGSA